MAQGHYSESRPFFGQPPLRSVNRRGAPPRRSRTHEREDFEVIQVRKRQKREEDARTWQATGRPCRRNQVVLAGLHQRRSSRISEGPLGRVIPALAAVWWPPAAWMRSIRCG